MRNLFILFFSLMLMMPSIVMAATLSTDGKPSAVIILGKDATRAESTAAKELNTYLKKVTGADFETVNSAADAGDKVRIFIGQTSETKRALGKFDWKKLSADGIIIKCQGNDLILAGDRPRGTLYSVYTFLEEHVGCRWWSPDAEYIPKIPTLSIADTTYVYKPPFFSREALYGSALFSPNFAVKLKYNGHFEYIPEDLGGHVSLIDWCHTFDQILPRDKYFKTHPEWYSFRDGKRTDEYAQLCLTNKEMRKEFIRNTLELVRKNRSAGIISISQNDSLKYCECPECKTEAEKLGNQTDLLLDFVNEVASAVEKEFPEFKVETLAYQYTRDTPKTVKPRNNVIIRLCSIECNTAKPLDSEENALYIAQINKWSKISNQLFVWDYVTNFSNPHIIHPNYYAMCENIKFFSNHSAVGIFTQGDYFNRDIDFQPLRVWLIAKLQWNPDLDIDMLTNEYLNGYYGSAGPYMKQILDTYIHAVNRENSYLKCDMPDNSYFKTEDYIKAFSLFDKASSVETDPVIRERIEAQLKTLEITLYLNDPQIKNQVEASGVIPPVDLNKWSQDYCDWAAKTHNNYSKQGLDFTLKNLMSAGIVEFKKSGNTPISCSGIPEEDWVELQSDLADLYDTTYKEDDEAASDGKTLRVPGNHYSWTIQMPLRSVVRKGIKRGELFVSVRGKITDKEEGFRFGLYDAKTGKFITSKTVKPSDLDADHYKDYSLGTFDLTENMLLWISPPKSPEVETIYVDRIFVKKMK